MGRSKFPGKPLKTATRKRIKVLGQPEATQSDPVTVAENIYYGLSLFNETFGDNEKVSERNLRDEASVVDAVAAAAAAVVVAVTVGHCRCRRGRAKPTASRRLSPRPACCPTSVVKTRIRRTRDMPIDEFWRRVARGLTYRRRPTAVAEWQVRVERICSRKMIRSLPRIGPLILTTDAVVAVAIFAFSDCPVIAILA